MNQLLAIVLLIVEVPLTVWILNTIKRWGTK